MGISLSCSRDDHVALTAHSHLLDKKYFNISFSQSCSWKNWQNSPHTFLLNSPGMTPVLSASSKVWNRVYCSKKQLRFELLIALKVRAGSRSIWNIWNVSSLSYYSGRQIHSAPAWTFALLLYCQHMHIDAVFNQSWQTHRISLLDGYKFSVKLKRTGKGFVIKHLCIQQQLLLLVPKFSFHLYI